MRRELPSFMYTIHICIIIYIYAHTRTHSFKHSPTQIRTHIINLQILRTYVIIQIFKKCEHTLMM